MGGSRWDQDFYDQRQSSRQQTGQSAFQYDADVKARSYTDPNAVKVHDLMNPFGKVRESCDSAAHPDSNAIACIFDVTGSMGGIPVVLQKKLGKLMALLLEKKYIADPQVLFGAVGDCYTDKVPVQIGQYESGVEMDDDLGRLVLEGNGGGQVKESYEMMLYYFARKVKLDCYQKRGRRGYLFLMGDEAPYPTINAAQVEKYFGDTNVNRITTKQIADECKVMNNVFFILMEGGDYARYPEVPRAWEETLGKENVLRLKNPEDVCELIASTIALCEGTTDFDGAVADLKTVGSSAATINNISEALKNTALIRVGAATGNLPIKGGASANLQRL